MHKWYWLMDVLLSGESILNLWNFCFFFFDLINSITMEKVKIFYICSNHFQILIKIDCFFLAQHDENLHELIAFCVYKESGNISVYSNCLGKKTIKATLSLSCVHDFDFEIFIVNSEIIKNETKQTKKKWEKHNKIFFSCLLLIYSKVCQWNRKK